jgi:hypothetical protein
MLTRSAVLPLVILALACTDTTPSAPDDTPNTAPTAIGMAPARMGTPAVMGSCNGLPNVGSIVKIESSPEHKYWPASGAPFNVFSAIIRDDASWPGEQYYCNDTNNQVDWNTWTTPGGCLTPISTADNYVWTLQLTCGAAGSVWRAIAIPKNLSGTILTTKRDTTFVHH